MRENNLYKYLDVLGGNAIVIISIIFSLVSVFYALDLKDTFYQGCNFLYSHKITVFLPLTQGLYILCNKLFGDYIIVYRILNWLFYFLGYLIIYLNLKEKTKLHTILFSVVILLIPVTTTNVFNGQSLSVLFVCISFVSICKISTKNTKYLFILAFSITCAILSRFPNIVIIPLIMIGSIFLGKKNYLYILYASLLSIFMYLFIVSILYHGIVNYVEELMNIITTVTSDTEGANHSFEYLFSEYMHTLKDMISDVKYLSLIAIIPFLSYFFKRIKYVFPLLFIIAQILFVYYRIDFSPTMMHYSLIIYLYSNICVVIFLLSIICILKNELILLSKTLLILLLAISVAAGSDTGLCLIGGPLFAFIPWLIINLQSSMNSVTKEELIVCILCLISLTFASFLYVRNGQMIIGIFLFFITLIACYYYKRLPKIINFENLQYFPSYKCISICIGLCIILSLCLTIYTKLNYTFHDAPIGELKVQHSIPQLKYIWTNQKTSDYVMKVMDEYKRNLPYDKIYFFGEDSAIFSYLSKQGLIPGVDFTQKNTPRNINAINAILEENPIIILCAANPITQDYTLEEYNELSIFLLENGYDCEEKEVCNIYKKRYENPIQ